MDIKEKVINALNRSLKVDYLRLEEDDGLYGFVVSSEFAQMSALDRQWMIEEALSKARLSAPEQRHILTIAGLTPAEYEAVGADIRVLGVNEKQGELEIVVQGGLSDAQYVRHAFDKEQGIQTTEPRRVTSKQGTLMSFRAKTTGRAALTKEKAIRVLNKTRYIAVIPNA
jgi:acid stress-induced BolA-like protein IbaG/YrbA